MLLTIPNLLDAAQLAGIRARLAQAEWIDGRATAGYQSARVKDNLQLPEDHPLARAMGDEIMQAMERNKIFVSAALPLRVYPPTFNRYAGGQNYGAHVDGPIRQLPGIPVRVRADLSATVFLSEPEEYEGGELIIDDKYGGHSVKLAAGSMVLYSAGALHQVLPVRQGARLGAFMWIQSMVRDDHDRTMLYDLDCSIQHLATIAADHPALLQLTGVYHNLVRRWAEC